MLVLCLSWQVLDEYETSQTIYLKHLITSIHENVIKEKKLWKI